MLLNLGVGMGPGRARLENLSRPLLYKHKRLLASELSYNQDAFLAEKKQMVGVNFFLSFFFWWFFFLGLKSIWLRLRSRSRLGFGFSLRKDTIGVNRRETIAKKFDR